MLTAQAIRDKVREVAQRYAAVTQTPDIVGAITMSGWAIRQMKTGVPSMNMFFVGFFQGPSIEVIEEEEPVEDPEAPPPPPVEPGIAWVRLYLHRVSRIYYWTREFRESCIPTQ